MSLMAEMADGGRWSILVGLVSSRLATRPYAGCGGGWRRRDGRRRTTDCGLRIYLYTMGGAWPRGAWRMALAVSDSVRGGVAQRMAHGGGWAMAMGGSGRRRRRR
jgi:hypothetical protein